MRVAIPKDPADIVDYTLALEDDLLAGETIATAVTPTISPSGGDHLARVSHNLDAESKNLVVWLEDGVAGQVYILHAQVTTTGVTPARTIDRDFEIRVEDHFVYLPPKDPADTVHLTFDATDGLGSGESFTGTPTVALGAGISSASAAIVTGAGKKVSAFVSGGTAGEVYDVEVTAVTDNSPQARTFKRTFRLPVRGM